MNTYETDKIALNDFRTHNIWYKFEYVFIE